MKIPLLVCTLFLVFSCFDREKKTDHQIIEVKKTENAPIIDGKSNDHIWDKVKWHALDQNWLGAAYSHDDFSGRYKLAWNAKALYLLVEITDDVFYDSIADPFKRYWNDDCLEIFMDSDNSGGLHQHSNNAFAYHIALDHKVVDIGPDKLPLFLNDHMNIKSVRDEQRMIWEIALGVYPGDTDPTAALSPITLAKGSKLGFALAYCDNDGSPERENFIGSVFIPGADKNIAWIDSDVFGTLVLGD